MDQMITLDQAARLLKCSYSGIYNLAKRGQLESAVQP